MIRRLSLFVMTGLLAGATVLGLTQTPASANGLSIFFDTSPVYVPYDDYRYRHDRYYRDRYYRHHEDYGYHRDYHDYGGYHHEDRGYHGDHGRHH
jgi:hypothetical protein